MLTTSRTSLRGYARLRHLLGATLLGLSLVAPAHAQEITILTGGTSGVYYPVGLALKKIFERDISGLKANVLATQASVENLNLLQQGKGVLALAQGDILNEATKGNPEAGFPSSRTKIRLIGAAYPNYIHILARRDSNIKSVADLRGKRVSVGPSRSGNELNSRALLGAAGMSYADLLQVEYLEYGDSVGLMTKGQLDAAIISAGLGVAAVIRAANSDTPTMLVPVENDVVEKTKALFFAATIPPNTYPKQEAGVRTLALNNFFVTSSDVPDEMVYRVTKSIFSSLDEVRTAHPAAKVMSMENALFARPIALHPGAARFFRESGTLR